MILMLVKVVNRNKGVRSNGLHNKPKKLKEMIVRIINELYIVICRKVICGQNFILEVGD